MAIARFKVGDRHGPITISSVAMAWPFGRRDLWRAQSVRGIFAGRRCSHFVTAEKPSGLVPRQSMLVISWPFSVPMLATRVGGSMGLRPEASFEDLSRSAICPRNCSSGGSRQHAGLRRSTIHELGPFLVESVHMDVAFVLPPEKPVALDWTCRTSLGISSSHRDRSELYSRGFPPLVSTGALTVSVMSAVLPESMSASVSDNQSNQLRHAATTPGTAVLGRGGLSAYNGRPLSSFMTRQPERGPRPRDAPDRSRICSRDCSCGCRTQPCSRGSAAALSPALGCPGRSH